MILSEFWFAKRRMYSPDARSKTREQRVEKYEKQILSGKGLND